MWASDFPQNPIQPGLNSREVIDTSFRGVPEDIAHKIVFDNANKLYRMGL